MPRPPYTCADSPAIEARIDHDLAHVVRAVRGADPYLRSLVLTGGFARGEGAVLDGLPQNDYDLVAIRRLGAPRRPYVSLRSDLERSLGLHIDLAAVPVWRLPWLSHSIFWYETALRGRTLWGEDVLPQLRMRDWRDIDPAEGARLLVNRAAGLLLATDARDPSARRLQAAKGLLAVLDARLLGLGPFPPSQTERWTLARQLRRDHALPPDLVRLWPWLSWAFGFKVDPGHARAVDAGRAWTVAARAIVHAVPHALRHAGLGSLAAYGRLGDLVEQGRYFWAARSIPGARLLQAHPTGSVRVATLALLEASLDGHVPPAAARRHLGPLARVDARPMRVLETLRRATAQ